MTETEILSTYLSGIREKWRQTWVRETCTV